MFERAVIEGLLAERVTIPHEVELLSPYAFAIHPAGASQGADYRVQAERSAFQLQVRVVTPYLGAGLRSAIASSIRGNPTRADRLQSELIAFGWTLTLAVEDSFVIEARQADVAELSTYELTERCVSSAALLSEFILDQLVVTQSYGEVRPAMVRHIAEELETSDPWLYDPEERDRSTAVHRALENWLITRLAEAGIQALDPASEPFFDLAWNYSGSMWVCEVKSTINSEANQLRLAVGQLLHYLELLRRGGASLPKGVILVSGRPKGDEWFDICSRLDLLLLWPEAWDEHAQQLTGVVAGDA